MVKSDMHGGTGSWKDDSRAVDAVLDISRGLACGTTFFCCTVGAQFALGALRISAASATALPAGLLALAASSAVASIAADKGPEIATEAFDLPRRRSARHDSNAFWMRAVQHGILGIAIFHVLGGRANALAPSNVARLGAFHKHRASLAGTIDYAAAFDRGKIAMLGRTFGCHTCGTRRAADYIADHMPPVKIAKALNKSWWRRLLGFKVVQRYVPQCKPCSGVQSSAVRTGKSVLVYHYGSLRLYHGTGLLLPAAHDASLEWDLWPRLLKVLEKRER